MSAQRWVECGYVERFSKHWSVLAVDPLGHGLSDKPHEADAYKMADCAGDVLSVLDAERVSSAHVWGFSRGAQIGGVLATLHPERVTSLVIGSYPPGTLEPQIQSISDETARRHVASIGSGDLEAVLLSMGATEAPLRSTIMAHNDFEAIAAAITGQLGGEPQLDFSRLRRQPMAYAGGAEPVLPFLRHLADRAGIALHVIPEASHSQAFARIDDVAPIVEDFLLAAR